MSVFSGVAPVGVFNCKEPERDKDHLDNVDCFANLTLPLPGGVVAGTRFIVTNTSGAVHPTWINLPSGLQDGDIIEKDFQNLNWLLATDVSECPDNGGGLIVWVNCECHNYWYDACNNCWKEISTCGFGGYEKSEPICVDFDSQTGFTLSMISQNPDRSVFTVNGQRQTYGTQYTISGSTLQWINPEYDLETTDCLELLYC